jgi:hypothetical protein
MVDLAIAVASRWSTGAAWQRDSCGRIEAIAAALSQRESTLRVWRAHFGGFRQHDSS